ncbi:hypothetical protein GQX74_004341 [Glossina fuscipes]|nr:hypothetical protein GQX74_004341 [Glossina fuscipes]
MMLQELSIGHDNRAKVTQGCLSDFNAITSLARSSCVTIAKAASGDDCIKCQMFPSVTQGGIEIIATILFLAEIDYINLSRLTNKLTNNSDFACVSEVCATLVHWKDFNRETEYYFYFLIKVHCHCSLRGTAHLTLGIKRTLRIAVRTILVYTMPPCGKGVVHNKLVEAQISNRKERSHFPFTAAGVTIELYT